MSSIILTGGGSGGHIFPNIALLPYLKKQFDNIYYIGEKQGMEFDIATKNNIPFFSINAIKLDRTNILSNFKIPFVLPKCISQAKQILQKLKPDVVFSKGGYVSLPVTLACKKLNIPYVIHESDKTLGVANKVAQYGASKVITSNPFCNKNDKYITLGTPLRDELFFGNKQKIVDELNLDTNKKTILIIGGSLGAKTINDLVEHCAKDLVEKYNIIHLTGKNKTNNLDIDGYHSIEFCNAMQDLYQTADIVISRAGAGVVGELKALGKKSILIPLSQSQSRGDQIENAKQSGFYTISQDELSYQKLIEAINLVENSPLPTKSYDRQTSQKIVNEIVKCIKK